MTRLGLAFVYFGVLLAGGHEVSSGFAAPPKYAVPKVAAVDASPAGPLPAAADRKIDFVRDIRPIFQRSCYRCHGPEKLRKAVIGLMCAASR